MYSVFGTNGEVLLLLPKSSIVIVSYYFFCQSTLVKVLKWPILLKWPIPLDFSRSEEKKSITDRDKITERKKRKKGRFQLLIRLHIQPMRAAAFWATRKGDVASTLR